MTHERKTRTLLIIDDDLDLLPFLVDMLSVMTTYAIVTAHDGVAGLEAFDAHRPDCVIVDVKMPELDGYQFVRAIRGDPDSANTPLIMLTAMGNENDRFFGAAAGVDHYLVKPVEPEVLVAAIEQALLAGEADRQRRLQELALEPNEDHTR